MNNCEMYQELISRLLDGELSREEYAALDAHMENCAECSATYAVFASLSDIIGGEDEALPEDLHDNIMAGVRRSAMIKNNKRRLSKPLRNALAAAACAAFVLFASRGLAPEKAADAVLSESQTAAMDVQTEEAAAPAAPAAIEPVPAPSETPVPAATAAPVASPTPTADIYLGSVENEAKPAADNTNKSTNSVVVTPRPSEIPVHTPVTVNTPKPTQAPANEVTITAAPAETPVVTASPAPAVVAEAPAQQSEAPAAAPSPAAEPAPAAAVEESSQPMAEAAAEPAAPAVTEAAEEVLPEATETPSLSKRIFSFFSVPRPEPVTETEAPAEAEESPAAETAEPETAMMFAPAPEKAKEEKKKAGPVRLDSVGKLFDLENLLNGVDAELPEGEADREIHFVLMKPEDGLEDYEVIVYIYGETLYYVQSFSEEDKVICVSECSIEDFEKFMDGLSAEEKAELPSPSPAASVSPAPVASPEVSPAAESAAPAAVQSPVPTEPASIQ